MTTDLSWLVSLPVVLPLTGAGINLAAAHRRQVQRAVSTSVLVAVAAITVVLLVLADRHGPQVMRVGGWEPTEGIVLIVDRLSAVMILTSTLVTLAVLRYAIGDGDESMEEDDDAPLPVFHPSILILSAGVSTTFIAGDLFHLYVGFEMLLYASFVLLTIGATADRVHAGVTYVFVSLLSSVLFLSAIGMVYAATGTINLAILAQRLVDLPAPNVLLINVFLLIGFGVKAAVFPMGGWLPDSYPTAPAPVTAVFAGLLTKVGVYSIIRTQTLLFPGEGLKTLLLIAGLLSMLFGILGAIAQDDIKRMLSFTLISHIGYLIFGIGLSSRLGLSSTIFYSVHHITIQTTLFLVVGLVDRLGGTTDVRELGGLARSSPLVGVLFFVPALNLAGIPPFSGFIGKVGLIQAGAMDGTPVAWALVIGSVVTSLLTLYTVARIWQKAFWGKRSGDREPHPQALTHRVVLPTVGLLVASLALSVVAGPLFGLTDRAATDLQERTPYIQAVLGGGS